MNKCPICGKKLEFEDVLFFGTRNAMGSGGAKRQPSRTPKVGPAAGSPRNMSFGSSNVIIFGASTAPKQKEEPVVESPVEEAPQADSEIRFGQWAEDAIHRKFMKNSGFWHGDEDSDNGKKTERFIVRWNANECKPGTAKACIMAKDANVPTTVTLCEEDLAVYGKQTNTLTQAMCPHCHCSIDPTYFSIPDKNCHTITLIGYPSCGKTEFKLALVQELAKLGDMGLELCDRVELTIDSKKMTDRELINFMNGDAEATDPDKLVFPVVFMVTNKLDDSMHLITLCDMPGEFYRNVLDGMREKLASNESLKNCDAAILMIDAAQLFPHVRYDKKTVLNEHESGPTERITVESQYVPFENGEPPYITDPMTYFDTYQVCKNIQHMSLVVTKGDLLIGKVGRGIADRGEKDPLLKQMKICQSDESRDHKSQVSVRVLNQVDEETMRAIRKSATYRDKSGIKEAICRKIKGELTAKDIRAFVISTLRRPSPEVPEFVVADNSQYPRHRILEPLLYLLAEWGAVPKTNEPWGMGSNGDSVLQEMTTAEQEPEPVHKKRRFLCFGKKA